jgi:hypothetical protein
MNDRGHYGNRTSAVIGQGTAKPTERSDVSWDRWSSMFLLGALTGPISVGQRIVRAHPDWDVARVEAEVERALRQGGWEVR